MIILMRRVHIFSLLYNNDEWLYGDGHAGHAGSHLRVSAWPAGRGFAAAVLQKDDGLVLNIPVKKNWNKNICIGKPLHVLEAAILHF